MPKKNLGEISIEHNRAFEMASAFNQSQWPPISVAMKGFKFPKKVKIS